MTGCGESHHDQSAIAINRLSPRSRHLFAFLLSNWLARSLSLHSHSAIPLSLQIALKPKFRVHGGNQLPILIGPLPKSTPSSAEFGHFVLSISVFIRHTHKHTHTLPLSHLFATNLVSSSIFFDSSSVYYSL